MVMRKQSYSESRNKIIYLINLILLLYMCSPFVLRSIPQIQTGLVVVYNNTNTELPASTTSNFTLLFGQPFDNLPAVAVGNSGYSSLDRYYNEFWGLTHTVLSNLTGLIIHVRLQANTKTNILFVSYFAVDDIPLNSNLFNIYYMQYNSTQLVNTSVGTDNRIDVIQYIPSNGTASFSISSMVMTVTSKVYMRNTNDFGFVISSALEIQANSSSNSTYSNSLTITIFALNTNVLQDIGFYTIILNKNLIKNDNYYQSYMGSISAYSTNVSSIFYQLNFTQSSVSNYAWANVSQFINAGVFMGFTNIMANGGNNIGFNWDIQYDASNVSFVKIKNNFNLQLLTFNFIIFGVVDCVYWSVYRQSCAYSCEWNETHQSSSNICRLCNSICKTCSLSTRNCTSCQYGLYYLQAYTCKTCNSTNLTDSQKIACGIPIDQPIVPDEPTVVTKTNPPYWLASLSLVPIIAILIFCYWRKNRFRPKIEVKQRSGLAEHPSIQL